MKDKNLPLKSIWGNRWESIRKWFYPAWLCYETAVRFYNYALSVYHYFINQQDHLGEIAAQVLSIVGSVFTFSICFAFLTIPGCMALFIFFKSEKASTGLFGSQIKKYF